MLFCIQKMVDIFSFDFTAFHHALRQISNSRAAIHLEGKDQAPAGVCVGGGWRRLDPMLLLPLMP